VISPSQCRAARALLNFSQSDLAARAEVSRRTIADFESDKRRLRRRANDNIEAAFLAAGVQILKDGDGVVFMGGAVPHTQGQNGAINVDLQR
jgi:transcriptional regulator with XRE-family HTH domain